jgi:NADP-dependent 3-hydroxy acid dehydrogenase YdfG
MAKPVCAIVGVGPGNGAAFGRKFSAEGFKTAFLARNETYLKDLSDEIADAYPYAYDVTDTDSTKGVFDNIEQDLGPIDVMVYNAGSGVFGSIDDISLTDFENAWRTNALGCLAACQQVVPSMRRRQNGAIVVIGATAAVKNSARFTAFTSAKTAQRALAQSMARHLGPDGIHVSYVIIDGMIDLKRTRENMPDKPDEFFLNPDDIAQSVFFLTQQKRSAWTFELDLRPFGEKW